MPRRRKAATVNLPPRLVKVPIRVLTDHRISATAFRLYCLIVALSYKQGSCDLNDTQLADLMRCSRQYVSRLLGDLSAIDLVVDTTLTGGKRQLIALDSGDLDDDASLNGLRLFEPVGDDLAQAPPTGGRAFRPSTPPHAILQFEPCNGTANAVCATGSNTVCATDGNISTEEEEDSINSGIDSSSSSTAKSATGDNVKAVCATGDNVNQLLEVEFAGLAGRWCRYFGDISPVQADLLGDYLDDPELGAVAGANGETAAAWILAAIEETALNEAKRPANYFRKVLNDWIKRKQKGKQDDYQYQSGPEPVGQSTTDQRRSELEQQIAELEQQISSG